MLTHWYKYENISLLYFPSMPEPFISISTDFGLGNKGLGVMRATILMICPDAQIIDLANDITEFDTMEGAKLFEAVAYLPVGHHICVVDPGVGTKRRGIVIETARGDFLIGPDNGVLIPATRFLGGIKRVHELTNEQYMRLPVSAIFHGRDVFAPAAAHLACGVPLQEFGPEVPIKELAPAVYEEALFADGRIEARAILRNRFGSIFLNVRHAEMHTLATVGDSLTLTLKDRTITLPYLRTFGDVPQGEAVIIDDDFGRVETAINQGSFGKVYEVAQGDRIIVKKAQEG